MSNDICSVEWACEQATSRLSSLGNRWLHVQEVVERSRWVGQAFEKENRDVLVAAAYLHDIGYAAVVKDTGFHPLDGACYLRSYGCERLASLVAYHSGAQFEAALRGYGEQLHEFTRERSAVADALTYCDMTTGPTGVHLSYKERLADIFGRYGCEDIVAKANRQAIPSVSLAVARTQKRLRKFGLVTSPSTS